MISRLCITLILSALTVAAAGQSVSGIVRLDGPRPMRAPLPLTPESRKLYEGKPYPRDEIELVGLKGGIKNVFVYVKKGLPSGKSYAAPGVGSLLDQKKSMFRPRVQGIFVGQELTLRNSDPFIHNVRSLSDENRPFNIGQPAKSPDRKKIFRDKEGPIELRCDFHPWMRAYLFVMEHPYFAVTDDQGRYTIKNLPTGKYTLGFWHEAYGEQNKHIIVGVEVLDKISSTYKPKVRKQ